MNQIKQRMLTDRIRKARTDLYDIRLYKMEKTPLSGIDYLVIEYTDNPVGCVGRFSVPLLPNDTVDELCKKIVYMLNRMCIASY